MYYRWKRDTLSVQLITKMYLQWEKQLSTSVCSLQTADFYSTIGSFSACLYIAVYRFCNLCCPCVCGNYIFSSQKKINFKIFFCMCFMILADCQGLN